MIINKCGKLFDESPYPKFARKESDKKMPFEAPRPLPEEDGPISRRAQNMPAARFKKPPSKRKKDPQKIVTQ